MEEMITIMYASAAFVNMISFLPQVIKLFKDKTSSDAISLQTQCLWLYTVIAGLLYVVFIAKDPVLIIATIVTFVGCVSITVLTVFNRFKGRFLGIKDKSLYDLWLDTMVVKIVDDVKRKVLMAILQPASKHNKTSSIRVGISMIGTAILAALFFPAHM